ncbi:MAG: glycosyltransferase family 39 protein [Anaerolineae bacterium]|jgi:4-amino-4-deoxy-L-arabinose transferase-like glycosyltransferase|nr:glycosyltransferase family 39 protein [Anaerolineae bacterium]
MRSFSRVLHTHRLALALLALVLLAALPVLTYPLWRDHGMYANIARSILAGGTPYLDMWDIKPPPIYYIFAAGISLFGSSTAAIRAIDFVLLPAGALGLYWLGGRLINRRAGALALLLYGVFYFTETYASLTQSDSLVTVPLILAAVCAVRAGDAPRRAWVWALLCGALCGVILWFKHYYAFFVVALVLFHGWQRWRGGPRAALLPEGLAFAAGGLLVGGGLLAYFVARGMWAEMLLVAQGTAAYNAQGYDLSAFVASMHNYLGFRWRHWGVLLLLAALCLAPLRLATPPQPRRRALLLLWISAGLAFVVIQAKGFDTHWLPLLPALCLLAAEGLERLLQRLSAWRPSPLPLALATAGLLLIVLHSTWLRAFDYLTGRESRVQYYARFDEGGDVRPEQSLQMVDWLQPRLAPGDTLYIWGFRPEVLYMGGWRPATRFQAQFPLVAPWYPPDWRQQNVDVLWAAMPRYVLVLEADYMPWVTGSDLDSHQLLVQYPPLSDWLSANYERIDTKIGHFLIWKRRL